MDQHSQESIPSKKKEIRDVTELWWEKQNLLWLWHTSTKKDRKNIDGTFLPHQKSISSTFTSDWYLNKGKSRYKMGEWLKKTTVRSKGHRRMIHLNSHSYPSNQTLGHIQRTCETLSEIHTLTHHQYWLIVHHRGEEPSNYLDKPRGRVPRSL